MAKPLKRPFVTAPADDEPDQEGTPTAEQQVETFADDGVQKIFDLLKAMDLSGGRVRIFLKRPNVLKAAYVGDMSVEQFKEDGLETLKRIYGGGDYTLQFADGGGIICASRSLTIDPRFKGEIDNDPKPAPVEKPDDDRLALALEKMRSPQQEGSMFPLLITLITESNKTIAQMMSANQQSTNTILTGLMQAISAAQQKPATDPALVELFRQKSDKTPIAETIDAIAALRELTDRDAQPKEKEDMIEKFVKMIGPPLVAMLAPRLGATQQLSPPITQQQGTQEEQATVQATVQTPNSPKLADFIPMLLNAARKGTQPEAYYEVIADNITEAQLDELTAELEKETWFETLFGNHPEVIAKRDWFEKLREVFLGDEVFQEEPPKAKEQASQ